MLGRNERFVNILLVITALTLMVVTGVLVNRRVVAGVQGGAAQSGQVADWWRYAKAGHRVGDSAASVTIVVFSDYQCPFCLMMQEELQAASAEWGDSVAVIWRHFPLGRLHPQALDAAISAECAAEQGRFAEYHRSLFSSPAAVREMQWVTLARESGVQDTLSFISCRKSREPLSRVEEDLADGRRLGITGTPTLLINGDVHVGVMDVEQLKSAVQRATKPWQALRR